MPSAEALGKVHVITGPGKGKTTAAFGLALRAAGHGLRVAIVLFMKTGETTGEVIAARGVRGIEVAQFGTGRFVNPRNPSDEDRACARKALEYAREVLKGRRCDVLILDEINVAVSIGLVRSEDVLGLLRERPPGVEVVLTGRDAPQELIDQADYVSYIESRKHPYDNGLKARKGIEW